MSVPRRFVGAWERESLEIDGLAVPAIGRAWWIECGSTYVDVRAPGTVGSGTSFGGRSAWRSPMFTWHHDFDLHPRPGTADQGRLSGTAERLIERGTGIDGSAAPYKEVWRRLPSEHTRTAIAHHEHGLAVLVGDHAALILANDARQASGGRAWQCVNGTWIEVISLGGLGASPEPHESGWRLPRGWRSA